MDSVQKTVNLYYQEMKLISDELVLLEDRREQCFQRFLRRLDDMHEVETYEKKHS